MGASRPRLGRNVVVLGITSLLTDASSEMIVPLLPLFLTAVLNAGPATLGLIEGAADTTASLLKLGSGILSDRLRRRKGLVVAGYVLSSLVRPLVALAAAPWHVLAVRLTDRVGKGIRTSPRDAVIADATAPEHRGRAYGFHRGMDHAGAVIGPLMAMGLLAIFGGGPQALRTIFAFAAVPAVASLVVLVFGLREGERAARIGRTASTPAVPLGRSFYVYLVTVLVFTLGNSSDAFLLLYASKSGVPTSALPLLWVVLHVVRSSAAGPLGAMADRLGRRRTIAAGWLVYAVCYGLFAALRSPAAVWVVFGLYGLYSALTEGAEKALVAALVAEQARGRAFGAFHASIGLAALPASLVFGLLWEHWGAPVAFGSGAILALAAAALLMTLVREPKT